MQTPDDKPVYRLLTGKEAGYMKAAQAVVWHEADAVK
jgi:hypothetical protein